LEFIGLVVDFVAVDAVRSTPGPVVRGPDGFDLVFENDLPVVVTYAEAGAYALHQEAASAGSVELGVFDSELEIADCLLSCD
jgi:hypothetical protein